MSAILERLDQKYVYYNAKEPDEDGGGTNLEEKKEPEPVEGYRMVSKYKIATLWANVVDNYQLCHYTLY